MKCILTLILLLASHFVFSQTDEIGKSFIKELFYEKNHEKAYLYFDKMMTSQLSVIDLKKIQTDISSQVGEFKAIIESNSENETYFYYSEFDKTKLDIKISFNTNDQIIGFFLVPHKEFMKQSSLSLGNDLDIKSGKITLKGTILLPEKQTIKQLVIFVHGSGPHDRDESIYENKPFKDIAETLFRNGIASYRFDKSSFSNPEIFNEQSTIDDEITNDIINIINHFTSDINFKDYKIVLLGHSLGANVLPRIANRSNMVSKIILLAGNSRSLDKLIVEQYDYLYTMSKSKDLQESAQKVKTQVAFLNSNRFNIETSKELLPLNIPAYYWKSILDYNPLRTIKKLTMPILVLQGERDYQVTMKDFELWKIALKKNKKASFISYPKLNHLFISGDYLSNPKEYETKGNVDIRVIKDISDFILKD